MAEGRDPAHEDFATEDLATPDVEPGGPAFDFEGPVFDFSDGSERATGERMRLSDVAADRPVALVFGSYT